MNEEITDEELYTIRFTSPELQQAIASLGNPPALTIKMVLAKGDDWLVHWMGNPARRKWVTKYLEVAGYTRVRNPNSQQGLWLVEGKKVAVYAQTSLSPMVRMTMAKALAGNYQIVA